MVKAIVPRKPRLPEPVISNVVSTFRCGKVLNLRHFSQSYACEFQPSRFAAASIRRKERKGFRSTALAFTSGKFVITGCRSPLEALLASRKYISMLNRLGDERLSFIDFNIQNIVSSVDMGYPLLIQEMLRQRTDTCSWERRKFPGLVFRDGVSKLVLLVFRSGKLVLTGAKSKRQITKEWPRLYNIIKKYRDTTPNASKCSREYAETLKKIEQKQHLEELTMY